jgi:hypothetical protein
VNASANVLIASLNRRTSLADSLDVCSATRWDSSLTLSTSSIFRFLRNLAHVQPPNGMAYLPPTLARQQIMKIIFLGKVPLHTQAEGGQVQPVLGGFALGRIHSTGSRLVTVSLRPEVPGWKAKLKEADADSWSEPDVTCVVMVTKSPDWIALPRAPSWEWMPPE